MFETYTQSSRQTVFHARFQASKFGSPAIEIEHLFLGLLQADRPLALRVFTSQIKLNEIQDQIASKLPPARPGIPGAVDLPLSRRCKQVLSYAAEEANRLNQTFIGAEHLLLGIAREKSSIAARIVLESGITISQLEEETKNAKGSTAEGSAPSKIQDSRDLVSDAEQGKLGPLTGRTRELEQMIQILLRRKRNNAVLIGEPGVGKETLVHGLAQRIAEGKAPFDLIERRILRVDAANLARRQNILEEAANSNAILYVRGLFDLRQDVPGLASYLKHGKLQVIATGAPLSFRLALDRDEELGRYFEAVGVLPVSEEQTLAILTGLRETYEKFHGVEILPEAMEAAISASARFLRHRVLPERAIDLIDEAAVHVKLRRETSQVTANDIIGVVAARTSLTSAEVKTAVERKPTPAVEDAIRNELAATIPVGRRDWVEGLFAYLNDCSSEQADQLSQAIRTVKAKLRQIR